LVGKLKLTVPLTFNSKHVSYLGREKQEVMMML